MLDRGVIGVPSQLAIHEIERGAVRRFAEALGHDDPLHHDEAEARRRGYPSIVAPLTFAFTLRPGSDPRAPLALDWRQVLHGEQYFSFVRPIVAGDVIAVEARIVDIYQKSGASGAMDCIVTETTGTDVRAELVYRMRTITIVRRTS